MTAFSNRLAEEIWTSRYRFVAPEGAPELSIDATWARVARVLAAVEPEAQAAWEGRFADALADFRFLPGGRILAGAGTGRRVTLCNCFVMGQIEDTLDGVFAALHEGALTMQQARTARASRRLGLGITGLADALIMLGLRYDGEAARRVAAGAMRGVTQAAYWASVEIARDKGTFPLFDRDRYLAAPFVHALPPDLQAAIGRDGIRNSHLTAIAPAGTISLLAGNVSSGIEPVFALSYHRRVRQADGAIVSVAVECHALTEFARLQGGADPLPESFVTVAEIRPDAQLEMQAALQTHVDNAIAKTVNVPADMPFAEFAATYRRAYALGLKGCTVYRPNAVTGAVLSAAPTAERCCDLPGADWGKARRPGCEARLF